MKIYLKKTKKFHEDQYKIKGINYQRQHPNEDVIRFFYQNKLINKQILDIGCGSGRNTFFLIQQGCKVTSIDFSANALKVLKTLSIKKKILKTKLNLVNDSMPYLKRIDKQFDAVVDCFASYCLKTSDFELYLKNMVKKIKKQGLYHLQTLSIKSDLYKNYKPSIKEKNSLFSIMRDDAPFYGDKYLFTFYSKNQLKKIIKKYFVIKNFEVHSRTYRNTKEYFEYFVLTCIKKN